MRLCLVFTIIADLTTLVFSARAASGLIYSRILPSFGNPASTAIAAITTDAAGNVYITGSTQDSVLSVTPGVIQPNFGGGACTYGNPPTQPPQFFTCPDAFAVKLDPQGKIIFATYLGGTGFDQATSIGVDSAGNVYIAGVTSSSDFPKAAMTRFSGGPTFIAKLNPTATALLYTAFIPGTGGTPFQMPGGANVPLSSVNIALAVDQTGNAYFASSGTTGFPVTQNPLQNAGSLAAGKLDPIGSSLIYGTYLGGSGLESVAGIAVDSSGNAYVTGSTNSKDFPVTAGALQTSLTADVTNSFVTKLNATGNKLIYSTYLGGTAFARTNRIRVDASGNVYVLGNAQSPGYPVTPNAFESAFTTGSGFLSKLSADGSALIYSTFLSTNGLPPNSLDIDESGNAYVAVARPSGSPVSSDALQPCYGGGIDDIFVAAFKPDGTRAASTYLGGSTNEVVSAIASASDGTVIVLGNTTSPDFPVTPDSSTPPGYFVSRIRISDPAHAAPCLTLALQNAASFAEGPIAPGELVTLRGLHLGPDSDVNGPGDSGVRVFFDGLAAPLLYAQSEQINAQVPWELAGKTTTQVHVEYNGQSSQSARPTIVQAAPAFFGSFTSTQGAILNENGSLNSASNPARAGSVVAVFGTGGGPLDPAGITGNISPLKPLAHLTLPVTVRLDGNDVEVLYSGSAPTLSSGVFQINFRLPAVLSAAGHFIDVKIGTQSSGQQRRVTIAIE